MSVWEGEGGGEWGERVIVENGDVGLISLG